MLRFWACVSAMALLSLLTPNIAAAQIFASENISFDQLKNTLLTHPYAQSQPACQRYKTENDRFYSECAVGRPRNHDKAYCMRLSEAGSALINPCMDVVLAEHKRQVAAKENGGSSQGTAQVGECVALSKVQERDSFGNPSCGIRAENNCSVATECQLEMTGVDSQGRRHPSRQAIHLRPGDSGARTINNVLTCENLQASCKAWKQ